MPSPDAIYRSFQGTGSVPAWLPAQILEHRPDRPDRLRERVYLHLTLSGDFQGSDSPAISLHFREKWSRQSGSNR